jgi:hypothetical protein
MESPELSISVGELIGVPRVTMRGCMDGWHDQAVKGVLEGFRDQGTTSVVLDIAGMTFGGIDGATGMINALRALGPEMCVHVVASGGPRGILQRAALAPSIRLYSSTDEIAEYISSTEEFLTSRWTAQDSGDEELPLAA